MKGKDGKDGKAGKEGKGKPSLKGKARTPDGSRSANASYAGATPQSASRQNAGACMFFGSAKGCTSLDCPFSHSDPNSVRFCTFHERGQCEKSNSCTYRHQHWASAEEAVKHYSSRDGESVEVSQMRFKQLTRTTGAVSDKVGKEHLDLGAEGVIERDFQEGTYGSNALRMMEKMGYKAGGGLGKEQQGRTNLLSSCVALEKQQGPTAALGFSHYAGTGRATAAERTARLADARAQKRKKVDDGGFVQHNLLSSDESSEGEQELVQSRDLKLHKPA